MLHLFESHNTFGAMNSGSIRYENLTEEDKKLLCSIHSIDASGLKDYILKNPDLWKKDKNMIMQLHHKNLGAAMGFDGKRMFMADQNSDKRGSFFEITKEYVKAHPNGWTDISEDLLVVRKENPGVVIGHPVGDCPVVMMVDRKQGIAIVGHCSGALIEQKLPTLILETLRSSYKSNPDDVFTYVSACAGDDWTWDKLPKWVSDANYWLDNRYIVYNKDDGMYHINLRLAILMQLVKAGIHHKNMMFNMNNTITDLRYYSNAMGVKHPERDGRHYAGLFYGENEGNDIILHNGVIKIR